MKLKNIAKNSLFFRSFKLAKSNPSKAGLMILFDVLFIVSIFVLSRLGSYFAGLIAAPISTGYIIMAITLSFVYYLITLILYSFFKFSILDFIKSLYGKTDFSFNRLGSFYLLTVIILGIFFAVMLAFNTILISVKQTYAPYVFIFLAVPYLLFLYAVVNISHSSFYQGSSIKDAIKKGFRITFTEMRKYREIIFILIVFSLFLWLLFLGSGYLIRLVFSKNYTFYLTAYSYFKQASIIVFDMIFYLVIFINRISFYTLVKEGK